MSPEKLANLFIQLSVFGLVIAVWMAGLTVWTLRRSQKKRKLDRRLQFAQQGSQQPQDEERVIRLWQDGKAVDAYVPDVAEMNFL